MVSVAGSDTRKVSGFGYSISAWLRNPIRVSDEFSSTAELPIALIGLGDQPGSAVPVTVTGTIRKCSVSVRCLASSSHSAIACTIQP